MAEQILTGIGRPEKPSLKDWAKKTFTSQGNEAAWRQKHTKELEEMKTINASLSPEDRAKAMEKIEQHIKNSAKLRVVGNYVAATVATAAVVGEGALLIVPGLAERAEKYNIRGKHVLKPFGWSARMARTGMKNMFRKDDGTRLETVRIRRADLPISDALRQEPWFAVVDGKECHVDTLTSLQEKLQSLSGEFPVSKLIPDEFFDVKSLGLDDPNMEKVLGVLLEESMARGKWQPIFMSDPGINLDGQIQWLGFAAGLDGLTWNNAIAPFYKGAMAHVLDVGGDINALLIQKPLLELIKNKLRPNG